MALNIDGFLTPTEHALVNHVGIPGVGGGPATIVGAVVIEVDTANTVGSLTTKTIPANTLTADGQIVEVRYHCESGSGGAPTLTIAFDGNAVLSHTFAAGGHEAQAHLLLMRTGATTCRASSSITDFGGGANAGDSAFTLDWSLAKDITFTFAGGTNENHRLYQALKWPEAGSLGVSGIGSDTLPTGTIVPYGGTIASVPVGFLPCDGSLADQTVEAELFAVIGTIWNTGGEPGGFFRLPDLRGKGVLGLNDGTLPNGVDGGFTTRLLAATGGEEEHTLTNDEIPPTFYRATSSGSDFAGGGIQNTQNAGGGQPHNNMQPFSVCAYIIKSKQVGGGLGLTAQNNGGALQGPRPTFNFIPSGDAGLIVADNPGQNRVDVTISATAEAFTSGVHASTNHAGIAGVGKVVQTVFATPVTARIVCNATLPRDNTVPQSGEGTLVISATITPTSLSNTLVLHFDGSGEMTNNDIPTVLLFDASDVNAIAVRDASYASPSSGVHVALDHYLTAPSLSPITYDIRIGVSGGVYYLNGDSSATLWGGASSAVFWISEIAA